MTEMNRSVYNRRNPLSAIISKKELLTPNIKEKKTWHIEIDQDQSEMDFSPGDSLAIFPENNTNLVDEIIQNDSAKKLRASMLGRCSLPSVCKTCQAKPVKRQNADKVHPAIA